MGNANCDCLADDEAFADQPNDVKFVGINQPVTEARLDDLKK